MMSEYSDRSHLPCLCIDSGSPLTSVALAVSGLKTLQRSMRLRRSSGELLCRVDEILEEADLRPADIRSLVGLRGPGSFTGLRVGLATLMGLQEALEVPATTLDTLEVLASLGPRDGTATLAVVDALRGEWFWQCFRVGKNGIAEVLSTPTCSAPSEFPLSEISTIIGFEANSKLGRDLPNSHPALDPGPLARAALQYMTVLRPTWDASRLCAPLYLRSPAIHAGPRHS